MTTVGFGVFCPTPACEASGSKTRNQTESRIWTIFFVLYGVTIIAVCLTELTAYAGRKREAMIMAAKKEILRTAGRGRRPKPKPATDADLEVGRGTGDGASASSSSSSPSSSSSDSPPAGGNNGAPTSKTGLLGWCARAHDAAMAPFRLFPVLYVTTALFGYVAAVGILYAELEGWTYVHGVYYAVISGTTVGYGDVTPVRDVTKLVSLGVLPFAVCFVGTKLGEIGEAIFSGGATDDLQKLMEVGKSALFSSLLFFINY